VILGADYLDAAAHGVAALIGPCRGYVRHGTAGPQKSVAIVAGQSEGSPSRDVLDVLVVGEDPGAVAGIAAERA
jgi:hypothetical protein